MSIFNTIVGGLSLANDIFGKKDSGRTRSSSSTSKSLKEQLEELINVESAQTTRSNENTTQTSTASQTTNEKSTANKTASQDSTATGSEASTQTSLGFAPEVMAQLNALLSETTGAGGLIAAQNALTTQLRERGGNNFDVDKFVSGIMADATARTRGGLETGVNLAETATGGTEGSNSMAALLASRLRNDATANLAGIEQEATATGHQIAGQRSNELTSLSSGINEGVLGLISSLAGAQSQSQVDSTTQMNEIQKRIEDSVANLTGSSSSTGTNTTSATGEVNQLGTEKETRSASRQQKSNSSGTSTTTSQEAGDDPFSRLLDIFTQSAKKA